MQKIVLAQVLFMIQIIRNLQLIMQYIVKSEVELSLIIKKWIIASSLCNFNNKLCKNIQNAKSSKYVNKTHQNKWMEINKIQYHPISITFDSESTSKLHSSLPYGKNHSIYKTWSIIITII